MLTSLQAISNKSRRDKKHRFGNLARSLNEDFLIDSWRCMNRKAATGFDNVTPKDYEKDLKHNIANLVVRVKENRYRAKLIKRVFIPKGDGRKRPLGLPSTEDKLLQTGASRILNAIYEEDFLPFSFGYRPKRSAKQAVQYLTRSIQFGRFTYVVEADIKGFFDNIDHDWLIRMLEERIDDKSFIRLIRKWLRAGILHPDGSIEDPVTGTPQGGIVSPVLANIYLHYALDLWFEKKVKRACRGDVLMCRYADDFVCAFQYASDAERFYRVLGKRLGKFGLSLAGDKTKIIKFSRFHRGKTRFDFLGFEFCWGVDLKGNSHLKRRTSVKKLRASLLRLKIWIRESRNFRLRKLFDLLNAKLRGYYNFYGLIGNYESLNRFYFIAMSIIYKWLNRRSQRRSFNYEEFNSILERYHVLTPRITEVRNSQLQISMS
jgi:RNA-directed DNA polymerase